MGVPQMINGSVLCLVVWCVLVRGWEEGEDNVNVISVENLDALLGLRMVTELNLKNLTGERRSRRGIATMEDLCRTPDCDCFDGVSCRFGGSEVLQIGYGSLSPELRRLVISNASELFLLPGAFLNNSLLTFISFEDIANVTVSKDVFQGVNDGNLRAEFNRCDRVTLLDHSFSNVRGRLEVRIDACDAVVLKKSVFSSKLDLRVTNVPNLGIESNTFYVERRGEAGIGKATIAFDSVALGKVPKGAFRLNGAVIAFERCRLESLEREAFKSLQLDGAYFRESVIGRIEREAFSGLMGIRDVELDGVDVQYVAGQALSVATNLTVRNSSIDEIADGAFDLITAFLRLTGNGFRKLGRRAFTVRSWNSIVIDGNEFDSLKQDTFFAPFSRVENVTNEFVFANNYINATEVSSLAFVPEDDGLDVIIENNTFREHCHCHLESWMVTLSSEKWESFYKSSNCRIGELSALCYDLDRDYMTMPDYTAVACSGPERSDCGQPTTSEAPLELDLTDTERTIFGVVFLGVISSITIVIFILGVTWMRRKTDFAGHPSCCFAMSSLLNGSNLVESSSISRINIHEYAEIQYRMTEPQKRTMIPDAEEVEVVVTGEDKATQTLPEELTQELLQSLREKLDDPENYNEARNMIEHLYDLIKVEESCNNNNVSRTSLEEEDEPEEEEEDGNGNIYDVIARKPRRRSRIVRKNPAAEVRSTGTRAPSPDKLSPVAFNLPARATTIVTDYAEPRDRKSNEYCELPVSRDPNMPDVLATSPSAPPLYSIPMRDRPLPNKPGTSS